MNIKLNAFRNPPVAALVFSRFMWMMPNAVKYANGRDISNLYFNPLDYYWIPSKRNTFDWVFDQSYDDTYVDVECSNLGCYHKKGIGHGAIEDAEAFGRLKQAASTIKIKDDILYVVNSYAEKMEGDCLGVHVRVGDMNSGHPQYGVYSTEDYINKLKTLSFDSLFIASDNFYSIEEIKKNISKPIIVVDDLLREVTESYTYATIQMKHIDSPELWQQAFIDCLLLSRCSSMLCRVSNLANAAQVFSSSLKNIYRL